MSSVVQPGNVDTFTLKLPEDSLFGWRCFSIESPTIQTLFLKSSLILLGSAEGLWFSVGSSVDLWFSGCLLASFAFLSRFCCFRVFLLGGFCFWLIHLRSLFIGNFDKRRVRFYLFWNIGIFEGAIRADRSFSLRQLRAQNLDSCY